MARSWLSLLHEPLPTMRRSNLLLAPSAFLFLFAAGCGESDVKAGEEPPQSLDLSKLSVEGMQEKVDELTESLTAKLAEIQDRASAVKVSDAADPLVDQLARLKEALGAASMPALDSLQAKVEELERKFSSDPQVMEALKPLLERLRALLE